MAGGDAEDAADADGGRRGDGDADAATGLPRAHMRVSIIHTSLRTQSCDVMNQHFCVVITLYCLLMDVFVNDTSERQQC